jgi:hypothetical protein
MCIGEWEGHRHKSMFTKDLEEAVMGKTLNKEKLEELRDFNRHSRQECYYWRQREDELEKKLAKCQHSFIAMKA